MATMNKSLPQPPKLRPTWTTWAYIGFMIAVIVLTVIGFWPDGVR